MTPSRPRIPDPEWPSGDLADAGFAIDLGEQIDARVADGSFSNLHSVLLLRHGKLLLERYYEGEDEAWGQPLGRVAFGPDVLHDVRSITKSIVGLLYGIALAEKAVPPPGSPLFDHFPEYADLAEDPLRRRMTVAHALSMVLGTEWDEMISYADPRNCERAMERADDRIRFVLDRPMAAEPGTRWVYNGGATAVLAKLITKGVGASLDAYAQEKLFKPLSIGNYEWVQGHDGEHLAASGLRLRPRDLAKFGQLVLSGGQWSGEELVPEAWLDKSLEPHADAGELDYGYQWWIGPEPAQGPRWVAGFGNGGQRLFVSRGLDWVVVVTAGNYNQPEAWKLPVAVITGIVIPGLGRI